MCRQQDSQVRLLLEFIDHLPNIGPRNRIETSRRFVEEKDPRRMDQAARNLQATPHAAGKSPHQGLREARQVHRFQQLADERLSPLGRDTVKLGVNREIFFGG